MAAAVLVVLVVAGGLLVALGSPWTPGQSGRSAAPPAQSPIGDPRTADPCSLLNVGPVQRFGQAAMVRDIGYPQSCAIEIKTGGAGLVWLQATFDVARDQPPLGVTERVGELTISREAAGDTNCLRTIVLGDRNRVYVQALAYHGATTDLCAVADAGTQAAVSALSAILPRRGTSNVLNALTGLDTCSLLDEPALRQVPGLDTTRRDPGFAGWLCVWEDNPSSSPRTSGNRCGVAQRACDHGGRRADPDRRPNRAG